MKKIVPHFLPLLLFLTLSGCMLTDGNQKTPSGYVRHCVRLLDRQALYANSPEWKETKSTILSEAKSFTTMDQAHDAVSKAAAVAGGKHSALLPPIKDTTSYPEYAPEIQLTQGNILHILLPSHMGVKVSDSLYIHTILDYIQAHPDSKGVILDLRGNTGGNMYPMIASVSPLLPDGIILMFKGRKLTIPVTLEFIMKDARLTAGSIKKFPSTTPVAILTDSLTASSGEATLLCFRGLDNVRTFGSPTAGYASANIVKPLIDGYTLLITTSCDMARTGEVFCDDPIEPDEQTDHPFEDAAAWIDSLNKNN